MRSAARLRAAVRAVCGGAPPGAYAGNPARRPSDEATLAAAWSARAEGAVMLVDVGRGAPRAAVDGAGNLAWVPMEQALAHASDVVLLGRRTDSTPRSLLDPDAWCFAASVDASHASEVGSVEKFADLRGLPATCAPAEAAIAAQARNLLHWHASNRFCGRCGGRTASAKGGWSRGCEACGAQHFPRTDPVVITAVLSPDGERCLLGRQASWPEGRMSCLAGFVDPGETVEEGVRREVLEEAGVTVGDVFYHSSQPWPNGPASQLMLGTLAIAQSEDLDVDTSELEAARWAELGEVRAALAAAATDRDAWARPGPPGALMLPRPEAIAHKLLAAATSLEIDG